MNKVFKGKNIKNNGNLLLFFIWVLLIVFFHWLTQFCFNLFLAHCHHNCVGNIFFLLTSKIYTWRKRNQKRFCFMRTDKWSETNYYFELQVSTTQKRFTLKWVFARKYLSVNTSRNCPFSLDCYQNLDKKVNNISTFNAIRSK